MRTRFWNYLFNSRVNLSHSNTFNVFSVDSATHPRPRVVCQSIYVIWFNFQYVIFDVLLFTHSIINWSLNHYLANLTKKRCFILFSCFFLVQLIRIIFQISCWFTDVCRISQIFCLLLKDFDRDERPITSSPYRAYYSWQLANYQQVYLPMCGLN